MDDVDQRAAAAPDRLGDADQWQSGGFQRPDVRGDHPGIDRRRLPGGVADGAPPAGGLGAGQPAAFADHAHVLHIPARSMPPWLPMCP